MHLNSSPGMKIILRVYVNSFNSQDLKNFICGEEKAGIVPRNKASMQLTRTSSCMVSQFVPPPSLLTDDSGGDNESE